jgi:hypothetical protein
VSAKYKEVFTITEGQEGKKFWHRIGTAFPCQDGSINVQLDALPINGKLNIRDPKPKDEQGGQRQGNNQQQGNRGRGGGEW